MDEKEAIDRLKYLLNIDKSLANAIINKFEMGREDTIYIKQDKTIKSTKVVVKASQQQKKNK